MGRMRGRPCGAEDLTGGPLDAVWDAVRAGVPGTVVERLDVTHPGDDDNVYFIGLGDRFDLVQLDCLGGGLPPFLIEDDDGPAVEIADTAEASRLLVALLEKACGASGRE